MVALKKGFVLWWKEKAKRQRGRGEYDRKKETGGKKIW